MAARRFSASLLMSNSNTKIMSGRVGHDSTVTVTFCNHNASDALLWLAYIVETDPDSCDVTDAEYMVFNHTLPAYGSYEVRGIAVEAGHALAARSSLAGVSVVAYGFEEAV